jgi:sterol desaturase/sphingolipid hydroxylase (fatty acid hydroxylase superfamily)
MSAQTLSLLVIVVAAFGYVGLERLIPYDRGQKVFRAGFWLDLLFYGFLQSWLLGIVIGAIIAKLDALTGHGRLHLVSNWPVPLQVLFFFVTHDFYIYCFHRLQHHSPVLWRIHEAHHSVKDVDWLAGTRSHSLEILVNQTIEFAPIVLLGGAPIVPIIKATMDAVWGMYIHSNLDVRSGRLQYVVNGPEMHRWHHARELAEHNANFATKLAIWDWLFGTAFRPPYKPKGYGLAGDGAFPTGYIGQHLTAFRPFEKVVGAAASGARQSHAPPNGQAARLEAAAPIDVSPPPP